MLLFIDWHFAAIGHIFNVCFKQRHRTPFQVTLYSVLAQLVECFLDSPVPYTLLSFSFVS